MKNNNKKPKNSNKNPELNLEPSFGESNEYYLLLAESVLGFFQFAAQLRLLCHSDFAYIGSFKPDEVPVNVDFMMASATIVQEAEIHITLMENKIILPPQTHLANSIMPKIAQSQPLLLFEEPYNEPYFLFGDKKFSLFHSKYQNYAYVLMISVDKNHSITGLMNLFLKNRQFRCADISSFLKGKTQSKQFTFLQRLFYEADIKTRDYKMLKISRLLRDAKQLPIKGEFGDPNINMSSIESMELYRSLLEIDSSFE